MKIAIPVNGDSMEAGVCPSFGRAPYFLIYDTESQEKAFLNNSAANSQGGAGIKAGQTIADSQVQALLVPRLGENAAGVIRAANIKIYKTTNDSINDNINAFIDEKLNPLEDIHPGFHGRGGNM